MSPETHTASYEKTDAQTGPLALLAVAIAMLVLVSLTGIAIMWRVMAYQNVYTGEMVGSPLAPARPPPPSPRLQVFPAQDLKDFRAQEAARLNSYGLVDKDKGIVHIPIDRAMDLIAQRGLAKP